MSALAGVRAAVSLVASHGVVCSDPVVLEQGSNLLVHLHPAPVVARVAARTALVRPAVADHFARDLSVSAFLASRGVPVVTPSTVLPAGPHVSDGFVFSFSTYVPHDPTARLPRQDVLKLLPELHAELRLYDGQLPTRGPLAWDLACSADKEEAAQRTVEIYGGGAAPSDVEFHAETRSMFGTLWGVLMQWS